MVARFGLFLQSLEAGHANFQARPYGASFWFGTGLIVLGVLVNVVAAWGHVHLVRELGRGGAALDRPSALGLTVAVILAALGLAMAVFLISVRDPAPKQPQPSKEAIGVNPENGIITLASRHSVDETVANVKRILAAKGVQLFAVVDHSGEAEKAGLRMPPTRLLIFGNPKAGTPWMIAAPSLALDLPLKLLVAEDPQGKVWISYNAPDYLQARHHLPPDLFQAFSAAGVDVLAAKAAE